MPKRISPKLISISFGVLILTVFLGFYIFAWTEPSQAPPGGNILAPLNVGPLGQVKEGGLILNTGGAPVGLIVNQTMELNLFNFSPISPTELGIYDPAGNLIIIFDQGI